MTSSMRVICEKMSTRDPRSFNRGKSLSSSTILPLLSTRWSPVTYGGPGSAPSNRYGWLQHLRSCMTTLRRRERSAEPSMAATSFCSRALYHLRCISLMPILRMVSFFGGRPRSTSAFKRRSKNGLRTLWSWETTSASRAAFCPSSSPSAAAPAPNHSSKRSEEEKTSGSRKLSRAHSSWRLFCSGVPVMSRR